jgi:hypothetical protein
VSGVPAIRLHFLHTAKGEKGSEFESKSELTFRHRAPEPRTITHHPSPPNTEHHPPPASHFIERDDKSRPSYQPSPITQQNRLYLEKESQKVAMMPLLDCFSPLPPGANGRDESIVDADDKLRMLASTDECKATIKPKSRKSNAVSNLRQSLTRSFAKMTVGKSEESAVKNAKSPKTSSFTSSSSH